MLGREPVEGDANLTFSLDRVKPVVTGQLSGGLQQVFVPGRDVDPVDLNLNGVFDPEERSDDHDTDRQDCRHNSISMCRLLHRPACLSELPSKCTLKHAFMR